MEKRDAGWLGQSPLETHPEQWGTHVGGYKARALLYEHGARIYFEQQSGGNPEPPDRTGTVLHDQSDASRRRLALKLGNATCRWLAMSTHTVHHVPTDGAWEKIVRRYNDAFKRKWGHPPDAWVLEMQQRGAPHLHQFHAAESIFGQTIAASPSELFDREGKVARRMVRGTAERWTVDAWLRSTRQEKDADAVAFNWGRLGNGGILELFDSPGGAGAYVAKECSKREQKELPEHYEGGLGRWWWMNPKYEPVPTHIVELDLTEWPWQVPVSRVWNWQDIAHCVVKSEAIQPMEKPREWKEANGFTD